MSHDQKSLDPSGASLVEEFTLDLPDWLRRADLLRYWGRDPKSLQEQVSDEAIRWALSSPWGDALGLQIRFLPSGVAAVRLEGFELVEPVRAEAWARSTLRRLLGLHLEPSIFEDELRCSPHRRLIDDKPGLSVPQTATVFDGALWVICGQQVSLPVAYSLRRRLAERFGRPFLGRHFDGLFAAPRPADIATVEESELYGLGLSRRKSEYLVGLCHLIAEGLDLEALRGEEPAEVEESLLAIRGFGPWSVNYLMMRSLGFADCVPVGDAGLARALVRYFELEKRPTAGQTHELMGAFAPHRSLATFHFWASFAD